QPHKEADGSLVGHIIHIDSFGNLITDIKMRDLPAFPVSIKVGGRVIAGLSHTYAGGRELLALIGSSDRLEISVRDGNARSVLQSNVGDEVRLREMPGKTC
ncbi:MAG: SAM-dependent chlorinase/fluorinase, partial [Chloroflexi bacterium]|nr:SAM-dependent chlorinase/fluorinase [Chloroflexota bacterium]